MCQFHSNISNRYVLGVIHLSLGIIKYRWKDVCQRCELPTAGLGMAFIREKKHFDVWIWMEISSETSRTSDLKVVLASSFQARQRIVQLEVSKETDCVSEILVCCIYCTPPNCNQSAILINGDNEWTWWLCIISRFRGARQPICITSHDTQVEILYIHYMREMEREPTELHKVSLYIYIPDRISLTEWKVSTLLQMVYIGSFCSYNKTPNQAFL